MADQFKALRDALAGVEHAGKFSKSGRTVQVEETEEWAAIHVEVRANKLIAPKLARYIAEANPDTIRALLAEVEALREFKARLISSLQHDAGARPLNEWGHGYVQASKDLLAGIDAALRAKEESRG